MHSSFNIGVNWISPHTLPIIRELHQQGLIQYCEIMVDNVAHLPAVKIQQALGDIPVGLHIIASRFLALSSQQLKILAAQLKPWIKALNPVYVSDHLVAHSMAMIHEMDYEKNYSFIKQRVTAWQELLDEKILFENHASITHQGKHQAEFFATLLQETEAGLLFDFSNAYIAEHNNIAPLENWEILLKNARYFHVGGFRCDTKTNLALDTHDQPIAENVIAYIQKYLAKIPNASLVIECNANVTAEMWQTDIARLKENQAQVSANVSGVVPADNKVQNEFALQNLAHKIFHHAPRLKEVLGEKARDIFCEFISRAQSFQNVTPNDWLLHMHFLYWLIQQPAYSARIDFLLVRECMQASVLRWSLAGLEHTDAQGVMLFSQHSPEISVGFWKSREAGRPGKIVLINIPENNHPETDSYAISYEFGNWQNVEWHAIAPAATITGFSSNNVHCSEVSSP